MSTDDTLDVELNRRQFIPLRDAFLVEKDSKDFLSLHRVLADVAKPLIYMGNRPRLDFLLRSLSAEFLPCLVEEIASTPAYYPSGDGAWESSFPTLEDRAAIDNRYCAFGIVSLLADTSPAVAKRLAKDGAMLEGSLRLLFAMYVRAMNPLHVEDDTPNHAHIASSSDEPRIWQPQARSIIGLLLLLATYDLPTLETAWTAVLRDTQSGAERVKVRGGTILEALTNSIETFEAKGVKELDQEEQRTLADFSTFLSLFLEPETASAKLDVLRVDYDKDRDLRVACSGCGKVSQSEKDLQACSRCRIVLYCSSECQTNDWKRYHKETCCYPAIA